MNNLALASEPVLANSLQVSQIGFESRTTAQMTTTSNNTILKTCHLIFYSLALACCLFACAKDPAGGAKGSADLLLKFEWGGPVSRPRIEVGLASEKRSSELNQWLAEIQLFRRGSVLSKSECNQIFDVLHSDYIQSHRTAKLDNLANLQPQYYLTVSSKEDLWYVPLGLNKEGKSVVIRIKGCLAPESASLLDPIVAFFPQ